MKILIVIDQYDNLSNGTTISAKRFVEGLRKAGNEVEVLSAKKQESKERVRLLSIQRLKERIKKQKINKKEENEYTLKTYKFPKIIDKYFKANEMVFAKPNEKVLKNAFKGKDVIHFYMPFRLAKKGVKLARKMHIPYTTAFHVQPENITYTLGLGTNQHINDAIYTYFRKYYNKFKHIHCPSNFIANQLKKHGYTAKLHIISNGVDDEFKYARTEKPEELKDKIVIAMVGRYAPEKRQDVLIEAVKKSKYESKIQLVLAGKGLCYEQYKRQGETLTNKPTMKFYTKKELVKLLSYTDLYVHSADAEIEAISCLEAIACGNVPIISNSNESATVQFAMDEYSLFEHGNSDDLAKKIDYFLDNPKLLEEKRKEYAEFANKFRIENSIKLMEEMFKEEIEDYKNSQTD